MELNRDDAVTAFKMIQDLIREMPEEQKDREGKPLWDQMVEAKRVFLMSVSVHDRDLWGDLQELEWEECG